MKRVITIAGALLIAVVSAFSFVRPAPAQAANYNPNNPYVFIDNLGNMHRVDYFDNDRYDYYDTDTNKFYDSYTTVVLNGSESGWFKYTGEGLSDFKSTFIIMLPGASSGFSSAIVSNYTRLDLVAVMRNTEGVGTYTKHSSYTDIYFCWTLENKSVLDWKNHLALNPITVTYTFAEPQVIEGRAQNAYIPYEQYLQEQRDLMRSSFQYFLSPFSFSVTLPAPVFVSFAALNGDFNPYSETKTFPGRVKVEFVTDLDNFVDASGRACGYFVSKENGVEVNEMFYLPVLKKKNTKVTFVSSREDVYDIVFAQPGRLIHGNYNNIVVSNFYKDSNLSSAYDNGYKAGYDLGNDNGYTNGRAEGFSSGYNAGLSQTIEPNWFVSVITSTGNILNIELFPNFKLLYLVGLPVILGLFFFVMKFIK